MARRGVGFDEGTATVKAVQVEAREGGLVPVGAVAVEVGEDGAWNPAALKAALAQAGVKEREAVCGLTGKDLVVKYQQVPPVADFQLRKIVAFELEEIRKQSGDDLAADFNVMPVTSDLTSDDIVLLGLAREERIAERATRLAQAGLHAHHFTPNALALYHAFRVFGPSTTGDVLVANLGKSASDFAVVREGDLLYARSVNTGGDVLTEALVEQFNVSRAKAESLKKELGDLRPRDRRAGIGAQQEKVSYALEGAAGRLFSLVQSTIQLAKSQMQLNKLEISKVWITGGTSSAKGLDDYLAASLGVPVQRFDPLGDAGVAVQGPAQSCEMTAALGLAVMGADAQAWSLEILAARERRKREFAQKHVFTVLALLLVVAYLGVAYWRWQADHVKAIAVRDQLQAEQKKRKKNAQRMQDLLAQRAELVQRVDVLEKKKAAGDGVLRTLKLLGDQLPEDLWVTNVELVPEEIQGAPKDKFAKRPVIVVDGSGKSRGTRNVDAAYTGFVDAVQALPEADRPADLIQSQNQSRDRFEYRLKLAWLRSAPQEPGPPAAPTAPAGGASKTAAPKKSGAR